MRELSRKLGHHSNKSHGGEQQTSSRLAQLLQTGLERLYHLKSWRVKGFLIIPEDDLRVQIVEWDKLLEFIVIRLLLPLSPSSQEYDYNEQSLARVLHMINERTCALPTKYTDGQIRWAHRKRNAVVHSIDFQYSATEQTELRRATEILEDTCTHILTHFHVENDWQILGQDE